MLTSGILLPLRINLVQAKVSSHGPAKAGQQVRSQQSPNLLTGRRFGRLLVLARVPVGAFRNGRIYWRVRCDCGNEKDVAGIHLKSGHTQSCGCLQREKASIRSVNRAFDLSGQTFGYRNGSVIRTTVPPSCGRLIEKPCCSGYILVRRSQVDPTPTPIFIWLASAGGPMPLSVTVIASPFPLPPRAP